MKKFVPIFLDWIEVTEQLNAQEKGRLIDAIVLYARGGNWQEQIKGNEKFLFPAFRMNIERNADLSDARTQAASARWNKPDPSACKPMQTDANDAKPCKPMQTDATACKTPNNNNNKDENENKDERAKRARAREALFERFWSAYPRHTDKQAAAKAFAKLDPDEAQLATMLQAIERQKQSAQWRDGERFIPHPSTWLNGRRWEDDLKPDKPRPQVSAQDYEQRQYSREYWEKQDAMRMQQLMDQYYENHPEERPEGA